MSTPYLKKEKNLTQETTDQYHLPASHNFSLIMEHTKSGHRILMTPEDIISIKADVIVSSIHPSKNLSNGFLSRHISTNGGPEICKEVLKDSSDLIYGQILQTSPGKLTSKCILFVCLAEWNGENEEALRQSVYECLKKANDSSFTSIAFPALGMGGLKYKPFICATSMLTAIVQYFDDCPESSLEAVHIAVQNKDPILVQTFIDTCCAFIMQTIEAEDTELNVNGLDKFENLPTKEAEPKPLPSNKAPPDKSTHSVQAGASALPVQIASMVSSMLPTKGIRLGCARNSTSPIAFIIEPGFNLSDKSFTLKAEIRLSLPKLFARFFKK
ncbi:protein mono-ADP-ribosyltransferase PARP14-like isoform X1 [Biomphalaria glabrata]|uniref:Protein mono-ADP-ribosyltransferase PARP14-like isoform X1 n=2 Tax=Biomphalaria glabrata TaxID=6526 RepID=A0A9W2ZE97_BIOGL|nr:protein mono-ADP-ribosyltransferase PARP14-like isoform X1 [Biomphalaria glabrata]